MSRPRLPAPLRSWQPRLPKSKPTSPPIIFGSLAPGQLPVFIPQPSLRLCDPGEVEQYCAPSCVDCIITATNVFCFGC